MKKINIGMVGSGFSATLHADAYKKVYGIEVKILAVASNDPKIDEFCHKYKIEKKYDSLEKMLLDEEIDVIDICTPPHLHVEMIRKALEAGKHVISEKPLSGYFGEAGEENIGITVSKEKMFKKIISEMDELKKVIKNSEKKFMYAENFVYAPAIRKNVEFIKNTKNKILFMKGEESHSGSHAFHAANWKFTGGGSFIRQGCHPLSAILYLKQQEAKARGEEIKISSVIGDMGTTIKAVSAEEKKYILANPVDVEDCANVIITFSDGTKANVVAGDMIVGGVKNLVEVYTTKGVYYNNIAPNNQLTVYHADQEGIDNVYITEKVETKEGWQNVCIDEEIARGYVGELQNFMECVAYDFEPESDFELAYDTLKVIYAAYMSSEKGERVSFE